MKWLAEGEEIIADLNAFLDAIDGAQPMHIKLRVEIEEKSLGLAKRIDVRYYAGECPRLASDRYHLAKAKSRY